MTDEPDDLAEVERRVQEIQRRKRGRIRWTISRRTAEMAIEAIEATGRRGAAQRPAGGKQRRRKRHKRLL